jgi:hypothetical protein
MLQLLSSLQMGGAVKPYISKCKTVCKSSYDNLSASDRKYIDEMLSKAPEVYSYFEKYGPVVLDQVKNLKPDQVLGMIELATKFLKKRSTVTTVRSLIDTYGDIVKDERRMKAVGAYVKCVLSHMDKEYKMILLSGFDLMMAVVAVCGDDKVASFAKELAVSVNKTIVKPVVREVKKTKK